MSNTGNENFTNIIAAPPRHRKDAPGNKPSAGYNTSTPASASLEINLLPWQAGFTFNFYDGKSAALAIPEGCVPVTVTVTGNITADGFGALNVGFAETEDGPLVLLSNDIALFGGAQEIDRTSTVIFNPDSPRWIVFQPTVNISAVNSPLTVKVIYVCN